LKVVIIMPAYNEESTIFTVIKQIRSHVPESDILVIDDGSIDKTRSEALIAGAKVISLPYNLGIGGAVQTGYLYAKNNNYDIAVQVDGDGQHDPFYIKGLIESVSNNIADMTIGSRYVSSSNYKSPYTRRLGMLFFSCLVKILTGQNVKDTTSGFRAVNRSIIEYFAENYPTDYPEVDVLVKLYKKNFRVIELPVEMKERQGGKSSINFARSVYYMIKVSLSLVMGVIRSRQ